MASGTSMGKDGDQLSKDDEKKAVGGGGKQDKERKIDEDLNNIDMGKKEFGGGDAEQTYEMKKDKAKGEEHVPRVEEEKKYISGEDVKQTYEMKNDKAKGEEYVTKVEEEKEDISEARNNKVEERKQDNTGEGKKGSIGESKKNEDGVQEKVVTILDQNPKTIGENEEQVDKNEENVPSYNEDVSNSEETNLFFDLKENEKKALVEFRSRVEEEINKKQFFITRGNDDEDESTGDVDTEKVKSKHKDDIEIKLKDSSSVSDNINLWGVPLLYSEGGKATDVVLLKFLRAREFKVSEALDMLKNTLQWRKDNNIDSILEEDLGNEFQPTTYINGRDREGHPVCYNVYGVLDSDEMYNKTLGTEASRDKFIRWRIQLMEAGIKKLDFDNDASCLLQIHDLQSTPGPSKKEVRITMKQVVNLFQENYPEFVAKNIFINVPFWYYAVTALVSPFLTQRTKSKSIYARPARVIETLLKYIGAEEIPICYGGLKCDTDSEWFTEEDSAEEVSIKANSTETIEIPMPQVGSCVTWELVVSGWEVNYKEEFVPDDEASYTIVVQKERKMTSKEEPIRNSFKNNEPGKIILIIGNSPFKTKKRAFYRYKINT